MQEEQFDATELRERVRHMLDCKHIVDEVSDKAFMRDGFVKDSIVLWGGEGSSIVCKQSTLYKKNTCNVVQRQVSMVQEGGDVWLGEPVLPTNDKYVAQPLATAYIQSIYDKLPTAGHVMRRC